MAKKEKGPACPHCKSCNVTPILGTLAGNVPYTQQEIVTQAKVPVAAGEDCADDEKTEQEDGNWLCDDCEYKFTSKRK